MKVIFPAIWITGFAAATIALFFFPGSLMTSGDASPAEMRWFFLGALILGAGFIYWSCIRLKRVRIDDQALYVSNYIREITVPLRDVHEIRENRWLNIHPITIDLTRDSGFGDSIVFMPRVRWFGLWRSHPTVGVLQQAVDQATGRTPKPT